MFKKPSIFLIVALAAGFITQSAQAIVVRGTVWTKPCEDGTYQTVYCLSDYHYVRMCEDLFRFIPQYGYIRGSALTYTLINMLYGLKTVGQEQKNQLYQILSDKFAKSEILMMVEDQGSDTEGHDLYQSNQSFKEWGSNLEFLIDITQGCINRDIPVINLECRQFKGMAETYLTLLPLKLTLTLLEKLASFVGLSDYLILRSNEIDTWNRSITEMESESKNAVQEIESCNSGPFLNIYFEKKLEKRRVLRNSFVNDCNEKQSYNIVQAAHLDVQLLDFKAIKHIYTSPDKKHIVVAMGGNHISNIESALPTLGYKMVYESGCSSDDILSYRVSYKDSLSKGPEDELAALGVLMQHARTFDVANFISSAQLKGNVRTLTDSIESKPIEVFNPDKLLVSMVYKYPTRFPYCLLLPKVDAYLKKEKQRQDQLAFLKNGAY